jgi:hypothetical protein
MLRPTCFAVGVGVRVFVLYFFWTEVTILVLETMGATTDGIMESRAPSCVPGCRGRQPAGGKEAKAPDAP